MNIKHRKIMAADEFGDEFADDEVEVTEQLDDIQDNIEDIQDTVDDIQEDDVNIDIDNNIVDHLIAECENCKGIFISAMIESEQDVESINGICPLCNKDTTQQLKWVVRKYPE